MRLPWCRPDSDRCCPGQRFAAHGMASALALLDVEDRAARHVVVDDAVGEAVERVALPHELAANGVDLRRGDPVGERLLLNADQLGREHQRREADDRHVSGDAVVIGRVTLRDGQRFAASLRRSDVVVELRPGAVQPLDDDDRGVMRLLHLHVAEIGDRFVVECPVVARRTGSAGTWRSRTTLATRPTFSGRPTLATRSAFAAGSRCSSGTTAATESCLMPGVAAVGHDAARKQ